MRFLVVGVFGTIVDFGTMNLLRGVFHVPLVYAGTVSFIAGILNNFTWNRYWTYPDSRTKAISRQLIEFTFISVLGLLIRVPILALVGPPLNRLMVSLPYRLPVFEPKFIADNMTLAIAVIIVMFWNFFANRYWTYADVE